MRLPPVFSLATLLLTAVTAFAQTPTFAVANTSNLDATFGNAGKATLDPQTKGFTGVAFGNGLFVALGASSGESVFRWATSPDGTTWTGRNQATPAGSTTFSSSKVHFLNGKFLFFVRYSDSGAGSTYCYNSADGLTWIGNKVVTGGLNVVEFDASASLYIAAGTNGAQMSSSDLVTWTSRPVVANAGGFDHNDLTYFGGKFYSTINGGNGTAYSSADGVSWTQIPTLNGIGGPAIEAGNGFILGTYGGSQFKSTDGVTFAKITLTVPAGWFGPGGSPRYTSAGLVATGTDFNTGKTAYMASADGVKWTPVAYLPSNPAATTGFLTRAYTYSDIAYGAGKFVIAGTDTQQAAFSIQSVPMIMTVAADAVATPPTIINQPVAQTISTGGTAVFTVGATGATSYQWKLNGASIAGATSATLVIRSASAANAGSYTVDAIGTAGTTTSSAVTLTLSATASPGRISNLSVLTSITATEPTFTVGTVIGGSGTAGNKAVVVRAVGPSLGALGVPGTIADPQLTVFNGSSAAIAANDNWGGGSDLQTAMASVGAFAYTSATSKDAAIAQSAVAPGSYSVAVSGVGGATGSVIAEIYDATPASAFSSTSTRLTNVSVLKPIPANGTLTLGFTIAGATAKTVLIRAVGPGLAAVGVTSGTLADPTLTLFNSASVAISTNDNWGGDAQITTVGAAVGAFAVTSATSKDAMLLVTLPPGSYTAQAGGVNGTGGLAIVEVYEVP